MDDGVRGFAAIELWGGVPGDAFEGGGQFRLAKSIPGLKHFAVVQKDVAADAETLESRAMFFELMRQPFANGKAIIRQADGPPQNLCKVHGAIGFQRENEARDSASDSDRIVAEHGGFV